MASGISALRAPLNEALGDEIRNLDVQLARAWRILGSAGVLGGLAVWKLLDYVEGPGIALLSLIGSLWFTVQLRLLASKHAEVAIRIGAIVEVITPAAFLVAIAQTRGAGHALGSYVPPLLFAAVMCAGVARLRSSTNLFFGTFNGVAFIVLYFALLRDELTPEEATQPLLSPGMQWIRATSFVAGGGLAYMVTEALRRAIGRAERNVRSHDLFGKYRLGPRIGAGGMGVVHSAVYCPEGGFERIVAVKLLHEHLAEKPSFILAFREEAELSARLVHPNIVQVLDFGRFGGAYFLAMEHVEGLTLSALEKRTHRSRRRMEPEVVAWIGQQLLAGLAFSHAQARDAEGKLLHVVHRDLCPSNVLVSISGEVKISDFGVAKALRDATFSETKTIAGHAGYMAPEQVRAEPIDERCDLFAVGVVLWELLAAEPLFRRGTEGLTVMALLNHEVPRLADKRSGLPEAWEAFFDRALADKRIDRFESAAEMSAELGRIVDPARSFQDELAKLVAWARALPDIEPSAEETVRRTSVTEVTSRAEVEAAPAPAK